jgi:nitrite reductase/ring-hydroxylating ferredoxin subunit
VTTAARPGHTAAPGAVSAPAAPISAVFVSRRSFMQLGLAALGAAWAGAFVQSRLFPARAGAEQRPVSFPLAELPVGGAKYVTYAGVPVIVLRTPETLRAFSLICTHLGCTVTWQPDRPGFHCACHDGQFDQFGEVTAGPPPVPLEPIVVTVADGTVTVGEAA